MISKRKTMILAGLLCSLTLIVTGCSESTAGKTETPAAKPVPRQTVDAFGVVKAGTSESISLSFPAIVEKVSVKEGQKVKKGDVLLTLDMSEFLNQIKAKENELATEKKLFDIQLKNNANDTDPDLNRLRSDLINAGAIYDQALADLAIKNTLFENNVISRAELDEFKLSVASKQRDQNDARFAVDSYNLNKNNELQQSKTKIDSLTSEINIMKGKLNKTFLQGNTLISDLENGLITDLKPTCGYMTAEPERLFQLVDLNSLEVSADVDESSIKDVKLGAKAVVVPLADKSKSYDGKVARITDMAMEKDGQTLVPVEIEVENPDNLLQLGYNVDVKIEKE